MANGQHSAAVEITATKLNMSMPVSSLLTP